MAFPSLVLGAFNLTDWAGVAYQTQVIAEGTSKGSPVPIEAAVKSWLQDGSVVVTQGYDNRTVTLRVKFRGTSLTATANAEAAFFGELGKPNTLTWTPASGPASVFEVVTSSMDPSPSADEDIAEGLASPWRTYNVRLLCKAFVRSTSETVVAALPTTGSTTTLLDACSVATGWTGTIDGGAVTPTAPSGSVLVTGTVTGKASHSFSLQKTFSATTSSTNILVVDWLKPVGSIGINDSFASRLRATGDGVSLDLVAEGPSPTSGYTRSWFKVAAASLAVTRLDWSGYFPNTVSGQLAIDNVSVTNVNPIIGTARQSLRAIKVGGSARAPGTLVISSSGGALGNGVLIYSYDADDASTGYTPPLRQFRSSGNTVTPDSTLVSGSSEPINGGSGVVFDVPVGLFSRGTYILMARLMTSGGGTPTITWGTQTNLNNNVIGVTSGTRALTITASYQAYALARMQLPTTDLGPDSGGAVMRLSIQSSSACTYDEVWLFNTTIGALIQVDCGTSATTGFRRIFVESPSLADPRPTLRVGTSSSISVTDRSGAFHPVGSVQAWGMLQFNPPQNNLFLVTPNATDPTVNYVYYKRWHTNAAE